MNNLAILQALAFEPRKAFAELDARPRFWWPLLLLVFSTIGLVAWYTLVVDLEWSTFQQLRQSPWTVNSTDEEIEVMARAAAARPGVQAVVGALTTGLFLVIMMLLAGVYFLLAGKVTGVERSYRHWLSMASWTSVPSAIGVIPGIIVLLTATSTQIPQEALQPLSLNELFFHREPRETGYYLATVLNVFVLIGQYLAVVGVKVWSGRSWLFSFLFASLPLLLVVGIWALFALR